MKKSFPLQSPNHAPARVLEQIKADLRKYIKRERRKTLPEEVDFWDFDCRGGKDEASAEVVHVSEITAPVDKAAAENWEQVYIEILAKPGVRTKPAKPEGVEDAESAETDESAAVPVEEFTESSEDE